MSKSIDEQIEGALSDFFELPYPDYNRGILPDEGGYDADKERLNYEADMALELAKDRIKSLIKEARIDEIDRFFNNWSGKKVKEVNKFEMMDYMSDRDAQLREEQDNE